MKRYFFNLSEGMALAFRAVVALAELEPEEKHTTEYLAAALDANKNHLSKVLQKLVRGKILEAKRGPSGGYYMIEDSQKLKLLKIYKVMVQYESEGGDFSMMKSVYECCHKRGPLAGLLKDMNDMAHTYLSTVTVWGVMSSKVKNRRLRKS